MSEDIVPSGPSGNESNLLLEQVEQLQQELVRAEQLAKERVMHAELKTEAVRAGIVDLDGLKLLDATRAEFTSEGQLVNAGRLIAQLKHDKPWLFGTMSSSSAVSPPPAQSPRQKLATDMTEQEYKEARATILKQRS
jgi:hypothetical protein